MSKQKLGGGGGGSCTDISPGYATDSRTHKVTFHPDKSKSS